VPQVNGLPASGRSPHAGSDSQRSGHERGLSKREVRLRLLNAWWCAVLEIRNAYGYSKATHKASILLSGYISISLGWTEQGRSRLRFAWTPLWPPEYAAS